MSELLHFAEHPLQEGALAIMAAVYALRIAWLLHFKASRDRQAPTGSRPPVMSRGILYSWLNIAMPWTMESTRKNLAVYGEFALFHIAVAVAIGATFIHPYAEGALTDPVVYTFTGFLAIGTLVGAIRFVRRVAQPAMRAVSTPDDYFTISIITIYFPVAIWGLVGNSNWGLTAYFGLTTFLLIYVPWSKISHYLYMPFTRFYHGFLFGRRGVTVPHLRSTMEV